MTDGPTEADSPGRREVPGIVRSQYDWASIAPSTAVVETLAVTTDREPTDLDTRHEFPDADALDRLIRHDGPSHTKADTTVSFIYEGHRVRVREVGEVVVEPVGHGADD